MIGNRPSIDCNSLMKHSFVISIDDRRLEQFNDLFKAHGLIPIPTLFPGVSDPGNSGVENCYLSHRAVISKAKELNWPYVGIFEDDAYPCMKIKTMLRYFLMDVPISCSILLLGSANMVSHKSYDTRYISYPKGWGSHSYVVFKNGYDEAINALDRNHTADWWAIDDDSEIGNVLGTRKNMFIQFCRCGSIGLSAGVDRGYCIFDKTKDTLFTTSGFRPIEEILGQDYIKNHPF